MQISKKTFGIIILLISIFGLGVWAYFLFVKTTPPITVEPDQTNSFFPGGGLNPPKNALTGGTQSDESQLEETPLPTEALLDSALKQLVKVPISGALPIAKTRPKVIVADPNTTPVSGETTPTKDKVIIPKQEVENYTAIRYVDRATGHVYELALDKNEPAKLISGTSIPATHEAFFGDNGDSLIARYLKSDNQTIESFAGSLPKDIIGGDALPELKGKFMNENISDLSVSPDTSRIFFLEPFGDKIIGITSSPLGDKKVQVFESFFHGWTSQYINLKYVGISTKPSGFAQGFSYIIDLGAKKMRRIVGGINGLISNFSPTGSFVAYSDNSAFLKIYDVKSNSTASAGANTFADKCVWAKDDSVMYCGVPNEIPTAIYPDSWYNGSISFSDGIWSFDPKTGVGSYLNDLSGSVGGIDAVKLSLSPDEKVLFFINKKDSSLWSLKLK